uniref:AB hydrolase-1 domain-containing protein n=1 Tax=Macrostomum lignano TaxID=282301 RepID=A0A1I8JNA9_9PLAT
MFPFSLAVPVLRPGSRNYVRLRRQADCVSLRLHDNTRSNPDDVLGCCTITAGDKLKVPFQPWRELAASADSQPQPRAAFQTCRHLSGGVGLRSQAPSQAAGRRLGRAGANLRQRCRRTAYRLFEYPRHLLPGAQLWPPAGFKLAYETWGSLNPDASNSILLCTGLSASSHARSHPLKPGQRLRGESFIAARAAPWTTDKFLHSSCANLSAAASAALGPSSVNRRPGRSLRYDGFQLCQSADLGAARSSCCLTSWGIQRLHAAVARPWAACCLCCHGLGAGISRPGESPHLDLVGQLQPSDLHRDALPAAQGHHDRPALAQRPPYYGSDYPKTGMKLAREIATLTYRSGPEWETRFGRRRLKPSRSAGCQPLPDVRHRAVPGLPVRKGDSKERRQSGKADSQKGKATGEASSVRLDPNSLLYLSKAMDLFDAEDQLDRVICPAMILGVQSDILFPVEQQRQLAQRLRDIGRCRRSHYFELTSLYGHDTFLLDVHNVGTAVKGFLETEHASSAAALGSKNHQQFSAKLSLEPRRPWFDSSGGHIHLGFVCTKFWPRVAG